MTTAADRSAIARLGAYTMHSRHDVRVTSAPGRAAFMARFEREVDPDGLLEPGERARRAEAAKSAHFVALARKSHQAKQRRKAAKS